MNRTIPSVVTAIGIAALIPAAVAGCGSSSSSDSTSASTATTTTTTATGASTVDVVLNEMNIIPTPDQTNAGEVTWKVKNTGSVMHEMVVIKTDKKAGDLLEGDEPSEDGSIGEVADLAAGKSKNLTVKMTAGHYALICALPGHYQAGMYKDFTVN